MPGQRLKLSGKKSGGTYTVKKGDNLSVIAKNNKTTVNAIAKLNNIKDKNLIRIGNKLKLP
ncbi:MAG TPA: LysM domain-containing protein [Pseudogracilibacillus sp.]|nr:LysM domain-containing protein [Pseudogracilibacillus sp.]